MCSSIWGFFFLIYLYFVMVKMYTKIGPWGGEGGSAWDDEHIGGIRQIVIQHGRAIESIQIRYDVQGTLVWGDNHGGTAGSRTVVSCLCSHFFLELFMTPNQFFFCILLLKKMETLPCEV